MLDLTPISGDPMVGTMTPSNVSLDGMMSEEATPGFPKPVGYTPRSHSLHDDTWNDQTPKGNY